MITYWIIFLIAACFALISQTRSPILGDSLYSTRLYSEWIFFIFILTILIGFRFEVGGDWYIYDEHLREALDSTLSNTITRYGDPGYYLINWISAQSGFGIYGVNLICGLVFSIGLSKFCRSLPRPWLALAVAIPYLFLVVSLGYSRQGVAIGFGMLALVSFGRKDIKWFVFWVFLAASFHKSAVMLLPIALIANTKNSFLTIIGFIILGVGAFFLYLEQYIEKLYQNYVTAQSQSSGAFIRLSMNALPALIYLLFSHRFNFSANDKEIWKLFSILSVVMLVLFFLVSASTALDRIALYMIPLQLVIFSKLPDAFGSDTFSRTVIFVLILAYYASVMFVWLNFAYHSYMWVPYKSFLVEMLG
tara:strand:- start:139 stop:1224 length:1086 start_codon:yes stop_codon:yes gene_type:complete